MRHSRSSGGVWKSGRRDNPGTPRRRPILNAPPLAGDAEQEARWDREGRSPRLVFRIACEQHDRAVMWTAIQRLKEAGWTVIGVQGQRVASAQAAMEEMFAQDDARVVFQNEEGKRAALLTIMGECEAAGPIVDYHITPSFAMVLEELQGDAEARFERLVRPLYSNDR